MTQEELKVIISDAVKTYGVEHQTLILFEEMSELQDAICKFKRGRDTEDHIREELADVCIILNQMTLIYGRREVNKWIEKKALRLSKRIKQANKEANKANKEANKDAHKKN